MADSHPCDGCGCTDKITKLCARCTQARYCGRECQVAAWCDGHKNKCRPSPGSNLAAHISENREYYDECAKFIEDMRCGRVKFGEPNVPRPNNADSDFHVKFWHSLAKKNGWPRNPTQPEVPPPPSSDAEHDLLGRAQYEYAQFVETVEGLGPRGQIEADRMLTEVSNKYGVTPRRIIIHDDGLGGAVSGMAGALSQRRQ